MGLKLSRLQFWFYNMALVGDFSFRWLKSGEPPRRPIDVLNHILTRLERYVSWFCFAWESDLQPRLCLAVLGVGECTGPPVQSCLGQRKTFLGWDCSPSSSLLTPCLDNICCPSHS